MLQKLLLFFCSYFLCNSLNAQEEYSFHSPDYAPELSKLNITKLLTDHSGFLWVGTVHGLYRFDGKNNIAFVHNNADTASLPGNEVFDIVEDNQHQIWVATNNGVCVLSNGGNNVRHILSPNNQTIIKNLELFKGEIIACSANEIFTAYAGSRTFERVTRTVKPQMTLKTKTDLWVLSNNCLGYSKDAIHFSIINLPQEITANRINNFCTDGDSLLYFSSSNNGNVFCYNTIIGKFRLLSPLLSGTSSVQYIKCVNTELIIKSYNHLWSLKKGENKPRQIAQFEESEIQVQDIIADNKGTIFLATNKGLLYANKLQQQFRIYEIANQNHFTGLCFNKPESYWLVSNKGVCSYYPYKKQVGNFIGSNAATIVVSNSNELVVQQNHSGIFVNNLALHQSTKLNLPLLENTLGCLSAIKDEHNDIWIWCKEKGFLRFSIASGKCEWFQTSVFKEIINTQKIQAATFGNYLYFIADGLSTVFAINLQNSQTEKINLNQFKEWKEQLINCIACNRENEIWLGTSNNGIIQIDLKKRVLKKYFSEQLRGNISVSSLLFDDYNQLWATTNYGLKKITPMNESTVSFTSSDGLSISNLEEYFLCKTPTDSLGLLSSKQFIVFHPLNVNASPFNPKVNFQSFEKAGVSNPIIEGQQTIAADYDDNISISFTAVNFIDPEKTRFAYTLENYECGWNYTDVNPVAAYHNLPEGDYELKVKASNRSGYWDVPAATIQLHINGPFWYKWWFYGMCIVALLTVAYIIYYLRVQQLMRIASIRDKISKDLHDDIGSALSSINIYGATAKKLSESSSPQISSLLDNLQQTAETTMENMSDIVWAINPVNDSFAYIINRLEAFSRQLLEAKEIVFDFKVDDHARNIKLSMLQRRNFYFIAKEAVNNAAKYSEAKSCSISIELEGKNIVIVITDNGKGFDLEHQNHFGGNGMVNMSKRATEMKGKLKIKTGNGGTTITLSFPIHL